MPSATGTILLVQESRFRLLTEEGHGALFLLAPGAPLESHHLPPLAGRRVRVEYEESPRLVAGIAHDLRLLDEEARA